MRRVVRENGACALAAGLISCVVGWLGLSAAGWNDYEVEAQPAYDALTHGHVLEFLRLAPVYGGSLIERAPFALLPGLWGGGSLAVYRMVAVPCLLAGAAFGVWVCARMRAAGRPRSWRVVAVGVCVANPMTLQALEMGHPEELLGVCLCVAAVLFAARGRALWAGVLLGLAIANKEWALLAAGPVLLALPRYAIRRCLTATVAAAGAVLGPLLLFSGGGFVAGARAAATASGPLFQPWQAWWFFGSHGAPVYREGALMHGYRTGPAWTGAVSHPLIVALGLLLAGALALGARRGGRAAPNRGWAGVPVGDALLLLALILLLRCVLDTWDTGYYMLPCSIALLTWETLGRGRFPILTLAGVLAPWLVLAQLSAHGLSPDGQAALFLAWTLPLGAALALRLYAPGMVRGSIRARRGSGDDGQLARQAGENFVAV